MTDAGPVTVTVTGLTELQAALRAFVLEARNIDLTDAGRALEAAAAGRARRLTGTMAGSITTARASAGITTVTAGAPWSPFQEYGTRRGVSPNRFMSGGLEAVTPALEAAAGKSLTHLVNRHF